MRLRTLGYAAFAGVATFLVVFVAVSEALLSSVEFSVLIGLPAGLVGGTLAAAFVLTQLGTEPGLKRRALARGLGFAGLAFVVTFGVTLLARLGVTMAIVLGIATGVVTGTVIFIREMT